MSEIDYTDPRFKDAAFEIAEATPRHLDQPTTPPIHWRLEGDLLRVLLADGRTVRAPLPKAKKAKAPEVMPAPVPQVQVALFSLRSNDAQRTPPAARSGARQPAPLPNPTPHPHAPLRLLLRTSSALRGAARCV